MGLSRFFFTTSLLLFSLLILVSAGDYGYTSNSEGDKSNSQGYKYTSNSEDKFKMEGSSYKSNSYDYNSKQENHGYTHELDVETSKSKEGSKQGDYSYVSKPDVEHYESTLIDHDRKSYVDKSDNNGYGYKPAEGNGYGRKMGFYKSKEESKQGDYDYVSKSKEMEHYNSRSVDHDYKSYVDKSGNGYGYKPQDNYKQEEGNGYAPSKSAPSTPTGY